ncbi:hypothetical protein H5410_024184 [Solanum commersonii]|uniref:Uncharacterized protein n=1 Tax=Solanum commersonii TaxID=4109 RepID=A0A9J5ZL90_SOLCO|nr:hypothetical protein H5410_024184 [Solanum commersonii]
MWPPCLAFLNGDRLHTRRRRDRPPQACIVEAQAAPQPKRSGYVRSVKSVIASEQSVTDPIYLPVIHPVTSRSPKKPQEASNISMRSMKQFLDSKH